MSTDFIIVDNTSDGVNLLVQPQSPIVVTPSVPVIKTVQINIGPPGPAGAPGTSRPTKAGTVSAGSFTGTPRKAAVVFTTPFADDTYNISFAGMDGRSLTYESKLATGFIINTNASAALTGEVSWTAMTAGET